MGLRGRRLAAAPGNGRKRLTIMAKLRIGPRTIGFGGPCFIIAEIGVNHNGDLGLAERSVRAAAEAGADAVKFQTFQTDRLVSKAARRAAYQETGGGDDQASLLRELELSFEAHERLKSLCDDLGVVFMSTPFDEESLDFLVRIGVPALKFGSGDLDNFFLLERAKATGLPLLVSTGMSDLVEVAATVSFLREGSAAEFALLHCVSSYPAPVEAQNLRAMPMMHAAFDAPVGFSDHTRGIGAAIASVAFGAAIIEKHFTLDQNLPGPDHKVSLEPNVFRTMVGAIRDAEGALGEARKAVQACECDVRKVARRSAHAARDLEAGTALKREDIVMKRPGTGMQGRDALALVGRKIAKCILNDTVIQKDSLL